MRAMTSRGFLRIVGAALAVSLLAGGGGAVLAGDKDKDLKKHEGDLKRGLAAGEAPVVVKAVEEIAAIDNLDAMKLLLSVALKADEIDKLKAEAANDVYEACRAALARMKDKAAEDYLFKNAKTHKDGRVRVILAEVCAAKEGAGADEALLGLVEDRYPPAASVAIKALTARKVVKAIDVFIATLAKVEKKREDPWFDLLRALTALTGQELETAKEWQSWWDGAKERFDPKATAKPAGDVGGTVTRKAPKLFNTEVLSKRCVFILDVSGSMAIKDPAAETGGVKKPALQPGDPGYGEVPQERMRMWRLRDAMVKLIQEIPADTRFTIITFSGEIRRLGETLEPATPKYKADAIEFSKGMQPQGFTWTDTALEAAFGVADATTFYLFTDGIPQRAKGEFIDKNEILEKVRKWNRTRKVKIYTIGLGEADSTFLQKLAEENDGKHSNVN